MLPPPVLGSLGGVPRVNWVCWWNSCCNRLPCSVRGAERKGEGGSHLWYLKTSRWRKEKCFVVVTQCLQLKIVPLLSDGGRFGESDGLTQLESPTRCIHGSSHWSLRVLNVLDVATLKSLNDPWKEKHLGHHWDTVGDWLRQSWGGAGAATTDTCKKWVKLFEIIRDAPPVNGMRGESTAAKGGNKQGGSRIEKKDLGSIFFFPRLWVD